jgi:hypothetical protein
MRRRRSFINGVDQESGLSKVLLLMERLHVKGAAKVCTLFKKYHVTRIRDSIQSLIVVNHDHEMLTRGSTKVEL